MKIQDLICEMSKFDSELEIVIDYDPNEFIIEITDNENDYYDFIF